MPCARRSAATAAALADVRPDDLAAHAVRALLDRAPELDPAQIDDVLFGDANGAGEDNRNVARMAVLLAGLPTSVPGVDGQPPVRLEPRGGDAGQPGDRGRRRSIVLVGGVESMSRAPWVLLKPERGFPRGHEKLHSSTLGWRMVNPEMPDQWTISLGESAEKLAGIYDISREAQDEFALRSHQRAAAAWDEGFYGEWVVPVPDTELERDESIRRRHVAREAGQAQARVRQGRHRHRGQLLAAERRRRRDAARRRGGRRGRSAASRSRGSSSRGVAGGRPRRVRDRAGRGGEHGARSAPASAGTTSPWSS